ncbi:GPP34 family phosphoprotein [Arsukibacterium sp.]|uniref:GOLPH3/VPS74 family protein n=1 Tax=Arsukibacterium sp. TaxID=1977258 RepID=UPI001BD349A1|nr:GPP34 family phosphoprotein [Arsukibacterium sp.]
MTVNDKPLFLYEELMLLALRDEEGTIATGYIEYAVAGAIMAELLLTQRISLENSRKQLVQVQNAETTDDPLLDECLNKIMDGKRRGSLRTWVSRVAGIKNLKHKVARRLCERGILHADEDKVLFIFKRRIYPQINPLPEKEIVERLRMAIFTDSDQLDPRSVVLISLADGVGLLGQTFGRKEVKARRERIKTIVKGELTGQVTKEVISACQTAVLVAAIMPAMVVTTVNT